MASSSSSPSANQLEVELIEAGNKLLVPHSSVQELLDLLQKVEHLLFKVGQIPSKSMQDALGPSIEAVIVDELVRHDDTNVKVSVASCISEILRIMAPNAPYNDQQLKEFFQLTVMSFEKLSSKSAACYSKIISILRTFWKVRLCVVMLDLQLDALIVQMFQHFFNTAGSNYADVAMHMEKIMTLVIEESEQFTFDLLSLLVTSVKRENQNVSPLSWQLGEKVLKNCAAKLKPYLPEIVRRMGINLRDYAETVALICHDASGTDVLETKGSALDAISSGEVDPSVHETLKSLMKGAARMSKDDPLETENTSKTLKHCDQAAVREGCDGRVDSQVEYVDTPVAEQQGLDSESAIKKRDRKPNSLIKKTEGYDHTGKVFLTRAWKDHEIKTLLSSDETHCKRHRAKDKGTKVNQDSGLELLSDSLGDFLRAQVEERASQRNAVTLMEKSEYKENSKTKRNRGGGHSILSTKTDSLCRDLKVKQKFCCLEVDVREQIRVDTQKDISTEHITKESETCSNKHDSDRATKLKRKRSCTPLKEKASKMAHAVEEHGEKLVGSMIKVWWPMDEMFYEGILVSYDHSTKMHKVSYTDGDEEILYLKEERWELVRDVGTSPDSGQGVTPVANSTAVMLGNDLTDSLAPARKKHKVTDGGGDDMIMTSSKKRQKRVRSKSKREAAKSINPLVLACSSKMHAKHSPSLDDVTLPIEPAHCSKSQVAITCCEMVDVQGYKVKPSTAPVLEAILTRHGDIAAQCLYKTASVKASLLEVVCEVIQRLQNNDADVIVSEIEAIESEVLDAEAAKIEVSWLRAYLETFHRLKEIRQRSCLLMDAKANTILVSRAARKDLGERQVELLAAQERVKDAESRVKALALVERKIRCNILEAEVEESSWREKLDGEFL